MDELVLTGNRFALEAAGYVQEIHDRLLRAVQSIEDSSAQPYVLTTQGELEIMLPVQAVSLALSAIDQRPGFSAHLSVMSDRFHRAAENLEIESAYRLWLDCPEGTLNWELVDPAALLRQRWKSTHCTIGFSGTLTPLARYRDQLGFLRERTDLYQVPNTLLSEQQRVIRYAAVSYTHLTLPTNREV